jgi:signal transduction histidine kinase
MRIRTLLIITLVLFGVLLVLVLVSVAVTNQKVVRISSQEDNALRIEREASELSYLSNEFLLYHERQQRSRWEAKYAEFSQDLSKLELTEPGDRALMANMQGNQQRLRAIFDDAATSFEGTSAAPDNSINSALLQVPWSRMEVQNQAIVFDAARLVQSLDAQSDGLKQTNLVLVLALVGLFGAYFLTNYYLVYRRILNSVAGLRAATQMIGTGNFDFAMSIKHSDEIGDLARAFNQMAANLKGVTASKAELEREVTERKQAEAALREAMHRIQSLNTDLQARAAELEVANEELERLAASLALDLRSPLIAINSMTRMIAQDYGAQLPAQTQHLFELIRGNTEEMDQLTQGLAKLMRITRQPVQKRFVNPEEVVRDVLKELESDCAGRQVVTKVGPLAACQADPLLLKQIWVNLLSNALKFTRTRQIAQIEIGSRPEGDRVAYFCKDNGVGFDMSYAGTIFQPFQRFHHPEEWGGSGVGLAIVEGIVRRHGGRVWAESEVDKGATFYFTLD